MASFSRIASGAGTGASATAVTGNPYIIAAGAVVGALGGLFSGDDNSEEAAENMKKAMAQLEAIGIPPDMSKPLILQKLQEGGKLTPAYEQALSSDIINPSLIQEAPGTRQAVLSGLQRLETQSQGGLNPEQIANMRALQDMANASYISNVKGLEQRKAQQGASDAGDVFAAQLQAAQQGAQSQSQQAGDIGAKGFNVQQQALKDYLTGMSGFRKEDADIMGQNAKMKQQADLWMAQNSAARQSRNIASENVGNEQNWMRSNTVNDANLRMLNAEQARQMEAKRQNWMDQFQLAQAKAQAYRGQADYQDKLSTNKNQGFRDTMSGLGGMVSSGVGAYMKANPSAPTDGGFEMPDNSYFSGSNPYSSPQSSSQFGQPVDSSRFKLANNYAHGGTIHNYQSGGQVDGIAQVDGDSTQNDTVPAMLSPGEIVVPRSLAHDPKAASKFVTDQINQHYSNEGPMFAKLHERLSKLEGKKQ